MNLPAAASAPIRLDLAGGWTDVGPYPYDFGGEVVNFAINQRVKVRRREEAGDSTAMHRHKLITR